MKLILYSLCLGFLCQNSFAQTYKTQKVEPPKTQEEADRLEKLKYHTRDDEKLEGKQQKMEDDPNHPGDKRKNMKF